MPPSMRLGAAHTGWGPFATQAATAVVCILVQHGSFHREADACHDITTSTKLLAGWRLTSDLSLRYNKIACVKCAARTSRAEAAAWRSRSHRKGGKYVKDGTPNLGCSSTLPRITINQYLFTVTFMSSTPGSMSPASGACLRKPEPGSKTRWRRSPNPNPHTQGTHGAPGGTHHGGNKLQVALCFASSSIGLNLLH